MKQGIMSKPVEEEKEAIRLANEEKKKVEEAISTENEELDDFEKEIENE